MWGSGIWGRLSAVSSTSGTLRLFQKPPIFPCRSGLPKLQFRCLSVTKLTSRETEVDGYWVFPSSWLCLALAVRKRASLSDPLSGPIPKSGVRGLLQQGKGSLKENSMGDKSEDQRGPQTLAPPRHQTAPLSSLPCFQLQSGREMVRIMTLSIRQTSISSTLYLSLPCLFFGMWQVPLDWWNGRKTTGWKGALKFLDVMRIY